MSGKTGRPVGYRCSEATRRKLSASVLAYLARMKPEERRARREWLANVLVKARSMRKCERKNDDAKDA